MKKYGIKRLAIRKHNLMKHIWNSKNKMKIFDIRNFVLDILYPKSLFACSAFRAMSIATTVVTDLHTIARIALLFMSTEICRSANFQCIESTQCPCIGLVFLNILITKLSNNISYFKLRFCHGIQIKCQADYVLVYPVG